MNCMNISVHYKTIIVYINLRQTKGLRKQQQFKKKEIPCYKIINSSKKTNQIDTADCTISTLFPILKIHNCLTPF